MDPGPTKAHEHPYGSTVIPTSATPPVVVATQDPKIDATIPPTVAGTRLVDENARGHQDPIYKSTTGLPTQQEMIDYAINILVESIVARVVEQVTVQLAPLVDRLMWAVEEMRSTNGVRTWTKSDRLVNEAEMPPIPVDERRSAEKTDIEKMGDAYDRMHGLQSE